MGGPAPRTLKDLLQQQAGQITSVTRRLFPAQTEAATSSSQSGAFGWMREMMRPILDPLYPGILKLAREYPTGYTGPVEATFAMPQAANWTTEAGTWITIGNPGDLLPDFRGVVNGQVLRPGVGGQQVRLQAGKVTDNFYLQKEVTTDANGFFGIDLSDVPTSIGGAWGFRALSMAGAAYGGDWPSGPVYLDIDAKLEVIGDASDIVKTIPAPVDGVIRFPSSTPGLKRVRLVSESTGALMSMSELMTGNIRSYLVEEGQPGFGTRFAEQSYVYDQALALMAAVARREDESHLLAQGIMRLQTRTGTNLGGYRFSGRQESAQYGDPAYRTGAHAFALHALLAYLQAYPQRRTSVEQSITLGLYWLQQQKAPAGSNRAGLYLGGNGVYTPDGGGGQTFQENYPLTWASTEHNIDAYFVFRIAERALEEPSFGVLAESLADAMMEKLWNEGEQRLNQGLQVGGPDTADPLDIHSWGSIFLQDIGESAKANETMSPPQLAPFLFETVAPNGREVAGYATAYDGVGYEGMAPHVWWEGTFSVAYALKKLGEDGRAAQVIAGANPGQFADGSFPYVAPADVASDLHPYRSVASTAWSVLANVGFGVFDRGAL